MQAGVAGRLVVLWALVLVACGGRSNDAQGMPDQGCPVAGQTLPCVCPNNRFGMQVCQPDLTLSVCGCEEESSGSGECEPGTAELCLCPDGALMVRTCNTSGSFGECMCVGSTGGTAGDGASGGTGGGAGGGSGGSEVVAGAAGEAAEGGAAGTPGEAGAAGADAGAAGVAGAGEVTLPCVPPTAPSDPSPADGATEVIPAAYTIFDWENSTGAIGYDVYLDTTCPPPAYSDSGYQRVSESRLAGSWLTERTTYCWQVVAVSAVPDCYTEGPVWTLTTACDDPFAGGPTVTSRDADYAAGTTSGSYTLTFGEPVSNVVSNLSWSAVVGTGTFDRATQVDAYSYTIDFSGVSDGDIYTLTTGTGIIDRCGNQPAAPTETTITVGAVGHSCHSPADISNVGFPTGLAGTFDGDPEFGGSCDSTPPPNNAVWFTYAPRRSGVYEILAQNNTSAQAWSRLAVFETDGCDPYGGEVACVAAEALSLGTVASLAQGTTYLIMFYTDSEAYPMVDPAISITPAATGAGTTCALAADLTGLTLPYQYSGTFEDEYDPGSTCDSSAYNQVWFKYTAPSTGWYSVNAINTALAPSNTRLAVFESDSCTPYGREIVCTAASDSSPRALAYLTQGTPYRILFHTNSDSEAMTNPIIAIDLVSFNPGEVCADALDVSREAFPYTLSGTFDHEIEPAGSCAYYHYDQVWFAYTPSVTAWYDITASSTDAYADVQLAIFEETTCDPHGREVDCVRRTTNYATATAELQQGRSYLIAVSTDSEYGDMVDPTIEIVPIPPPLSGLNCQNPADTAAPNYYPGSGGEDCWTWGEDTSDTVNDHTFTCDSSVGGDVVVEYTTGPSQTTLNFDATIRNYSTSGYVAVEVTGASCTTGSSIYCQTGGTTLSSSVSVSPQTTYYFWVCDGYNSHKRPDVDVCLW